MNPTHSRQSGFTLLENACRPTIAGLTLAVLFQHPTGKPLGHVQLGRDMLNARLTTGSAQEIPQRGFFQHKLFRREISHRLRQAPVLPLHALSRFTWSSFKPPYSARHR